jgi:hypothetical protein
MSDAGNLKGTMPAEYPVYTSACGTRLDTAESVRPHPGMDRTECVKDGGRTRRRNHGV